MVAPPKPWLNRGRLSKLQIPRRFAVAPATSSVRSSARTGIQLGSRTLRGFLLEIPVEVLSAPDYCYDADEGDKMPPLAWLRKNVRRSALIVAASVVGMPCGKPL